MPYGAWYPSNLWIFCSRTWYCFFFHDFNSVGFEQSLFSGDISRVQAYSFKVILERLRKQYDLALFDGFFGTTDYGALVAAQLAEMYKKPTTSVRNLLKLQHKFYSRSLQIELVPEAVPDFFLHTQNIKRKYEFPLFLKNVYSRLSSFAYLIENQQQFNQTIQSKSLPRSFFFFI